MAEYINKEDAKRAIKQNILRFFDRWETLQDDYSAGLVDGCKTDVEAIDAIPAADVAPVRRGNWIPILDGDGAECSECGEYFDTGGFAAFIKVYRYCPTCGARMDGEK